MKTKTTTKRSLNKKAILFAIFCLSMGIHSYAAGLSLSARENSVSKVNRQILESNLSGRITSRDSMGILAQYDFIKAQRSLTLERFIQAASFIGVSTGVFSVTVLLFIIRKRLKGLFW